MENAFKFANSANSLKYNQRNTIWVEWVSDYIITKPREPCNQKDRMIFVESKGFCSLEGDKNTKRHMSFHKTNNITSFGLLIWLLKPPLTKMKV